MYCRGVMGVFVLVASVCGCSLLVETTDLTGGQTKGGEDGGPSTGGPSTDGGPSTGDKDGGVPSDEACAAALATTRFDFAASEQGWTHGASDDATGKWPYDPWTHGEDPLCVNGRCFGAELGKNYAQCQRGYMLSPKIDLASCAHKKVSVAFTHAHAFWSGEYNDAMWFDGGIVEVSGDDGQTWQIPDATYPGTVRINPRRTVNSVPFNCARENAFHVHEKPGFVGDQATTTTEIELPVSVLTRQLRIRFAQASGVSSITSDADQSRLGTKSGWRIDEVHLLTK